MKRLRLHCFSFKFSRRAPISTLFPYTTLFRSRFNLARHGGRQRAGGPEKLRPPQRFSELSIQFFDSLFRTLDRKSTRLNSSHTVISYAVFCLKKKNQGILR